MLLVSVGIVFISDSLNSIKLILFLCGLWWFCFSLFPFFQLKTRPGPKFPPNVPRFFLGWKQLWDTAKNARRLPQLGRYLLAYILFSDGVATMASTTILFAQKDLGMGSQDLVILSLEIPLLAFVGNFFFYVLQKRYAIRSRSILLFCLLAICIVPLYALLGYIAPFGLLTPSELYGIGVIYGLLIGALQSYARTVFAEFIPRGRESEFYALYEITDNGSSWIGPVVVSAIYEVTHSFRPGMWYLLACFLLSAAVLAFVDVDEGQRQALSFSMEDFMKSNQRDSVRLTPQELSVVQEEPARV
eukprot:GILI01010644.1.p1 GENE.GILI01010644.1~~GILI01010644.1.p1  ORF type:complete len:330 (+),score=114.16 GILI01010644.1:85-990(+)